MATAAAHTTSPTSDFVVNFRDFLLGFLHQEFATTKKVIAAIPEDKREWRPDPKAKSAEELAWHIASASVHLAEGVAAGSFANLPKVDKPATIAEINAWYEKHYPEALAKVAKLSADQLSKRIDLMGILNLRGYEYLMVLSNNHIVHHRGQLSTYLRPMGSKIPSIYGPSADTPVGQ